MDVDTLLEQLFGDAAGFAALTLTEARPQNTHTRKVTARPVVIKGEMRVQFERLLTDNKAVHQNATPREAANLVRSLLQTDWKQGLFRGTNGGQYHVTHDKSGRPHVRTKPAHAETTKPPAPLPMHDRRKNHLLGANAPIDFLVHLGVQNKSGEIKAGRYDKWKQINRFLEMVDDVARFLPQTEVLRVVDFGSGKSYLTFALHHYFMVVKKRPVQIVGLDLKPDVVAHCNEIAAELGIAPEVLRFSVGDIAGTGNALFAGKSVHLVVSLHACDTATDDALIQAVAWNAPVILSVPCCQHELHHKITSPDSRPLLKHGLLKERTAALVTDALRAQVLEIAGYEVQVLEFIDMEHTPKNLLLRAVRRPKPLSKAAQRAQIVEYRAFCDAWSLHHPYLETAWEERAGVPLFPTDGSEEETE